MARESWWGLAGTALLLGALGFLPLLGGPRYEAALVSGLVAPPIAAVSGALFASRMSGRAPIWVLGRALTAGALYGVAVVGIAFLHGARVGFCDPWSGFVLQLLGPSAGAVLGSAWGAVAGTAVAALVAGGLVRRRRLFAVAGGLLGPLVGVVVSVLRFVTSPMVFAFDPFVGYFAGPLYEVVSVPVDRLLTYRAGTLATLLALVGCALHVGWVGGPRGLRFRWLRPPDTSVSVVTALFAGLAAALAASGTSLGHFSTTASIREALGRSLSYGRCDVTYAAHLRASDVLRLARECDGHLHQLERHFGVSGPERVTVFLFADAGQKGLLMGAANTYIAKPWRREIYLQPAGFPHPVLRHELAHVVAGSFGAGPFRVSGPLGGLVPDPGRVEGIAVAAAPREDADITTEQWTAAMKELALLPSLDQVFRLTFFGQSSARGYTVAGAFMDWLGRTHGRESVRGWYSGETLEALTGHTLSELEQRWHAHLSSIALPDAVLREAKARFEAPAIFGRTCPHEVDRLYGEAASLLAVGDARQAQDRLDHLLRLDPSHGPARVLLPACALRAGAPERALRAYEALGVDATRTSPERVDALGAAGDTAFALGRLSEARALYDQALEGAVGEHQRRTLEVKRWALGASPTARSAIKTLLIGEPTTGPQWELAAPEIGAWAVREPDNGLPAYLIGRNLYGRGFFRQAAEHLEAALARELPLASVQREALRIAFLARCAVADPPRARISYRALRALPLSDARREGLESLAERCGVTSPEDMKTPVD